jgi:hypothetical protein
VEQENCGKPPTSSLKEAEETEEGSGNTKRTIERLKKRNVLKINIRIGVNYRNDDRERTR